MRTLATPYFWCFDRVADVFDTQYHSPLSKRVANHIWSKRNIKAIGHFWTRLVLSSKYLRAMSWSDPRVRCVCDVIQS